MQSNDLTESIAKLEQELGLEAMLKWITEKMRASLDESQVLQTAVQELALKLKADCCYIPLSTPEQQKSPISYQYTNQKSSFKVGVLYMSDFLQVYPQFVQEMSFLNEENIPEAIVSQNGILTCPVCDRQGGLGELWLFHEHHLPFEEFQVRLVQQVAIQCAQAIRQAQQYQNSVQQVEKLQKFNTLKDDFLNSVCHELRTPIANMRMAIQMLEIILDQSNLETENSRKMSDYIDNEKVFRYLDILQKECDRQIHLIDALLDLQRIDDGLEPLAMTEIFLQNWIPYALEPFVEAIKSQQQILEVDIPAELPPIISDSFCFGRIITELLNNACKYTPPGEKITVTAQKLSGKVQLTVKNYGVEISDSKLDRIFEKFYRIPNLNSYHKDGSGLGLGLALVKKLAEYLGVTIQVKSSDHQTCFVMSFPIFQGG